MTSEIELTLWDRTGMTMIATLDDAFDISWQDALNDIGIGKFSLPIDDYNVALLVPGYLVRCNYHGALSVYSWRIEQVIWDRVAEESDQKVDVSGRGRDARFYDTLVYPPKGVDQSPAIENRSMSFASPEFDDSAWPLAHMVCVYGDMTRQWKDIVDGVLIPAPFGWPDWVALQVNTYWIWSADVQTIGTCYFRQKFSLATDQEVTILASGDNFWTLYLDGSALLGDSTNPLAWKEHRLWKGVLSAGVHYLAAVVENISPVGTGQTFSPAGFICAAYIEHPASCDGADPPNCVEVPPTVLTVSDGFWKCLAYPANEPGFTPGRFIQQLYNESRARGQLIDIEITFNETFDSNGQAWQVMPEVGADIGATVFDVLLNLSSGYWVDFHMSDYDYVPGGGGIPVPTGPAPPPPPITFPPNVPLLSCFNPTIGNSPTFNLTSAFISWTDSSVAVPGQTVTFDIQQSVDGGAWTDVVLGLAYQSTGNHTVAWQIPDTVACAPSGGVTIPPGMDRTLCWSNVIAGYPHTIGMRVRAKWTSGGNVYASEWVQGINRF